MVSSSSPPSWIILSKAVRVSDNQHNDASIDDAALPPGLSHLTVSASIFPRYPNAQEAAARLLPRVLAADLSNGLLLLTTTSPDTWPVLDVFASPMTAYHVPIPGRDVLDRTSLGVICAPTGGNFKVVGFDYQVQQHGSPLAGAWLHYYSHDPLEGGQLMMIKAVNNPLPRRRWDFSDVIAHDGRLWWVDATAGLLSCDPFADIPAMDLVAHPDLLRARDDGSPGAHDHLRGFCSQCSRIPLPARRRVQVGDGKLRLVMMLCGHMDWPSVTRGGAPTVVELTLADDPMFGIDSQRERWRWGFTDQHWLSFADIWASDSYKQTGLPEEEPVLACIHPYNPAVVYFVLDRQLFGVHMLNKEVMPGWQPNQQLISEPNDVSAASLAYDGWRVDVG